jgi:hypothetical protein
VVNGHAEVTVSCVHLAVRQQGRDAALEANLGRSGAFAT